MTFSQEIWIEYKKRQIGESCQKIRSKSSTEDLLLKRQEEPNLHSVPIMDTNSTRPIELLNFTTNVSTTTAPPAQQGEVLDGDIIRNLPQYMSAYWLDTVYLWMLTIVGLIGNSLSLVTILRIPPLTSSSLYVVFLAIMDSCALVIKLIYQQVTKYDIGIGNAGCRSLLFLGNTSVMTANWLVVAMTAERLIAIWFPLKVSAISTKTKTFLVYMFLVLVFMGINVVYLFTFGEIWDDVTFYSCTPIAEYREFVFDTFFWIDAAFYAVVPCCLLLMFNTLIIIGTSRSLKMQKKMTQNQDQIEEKRRQQNQITAMLVTVSVIFVILTIPNGVYFMTTSIWNPTTNAAYAEKVLVEKIILFLSDCNHAVNFFLYFLSGRRFRTMFLKTFCGLCIKRSKHDSTTNANSVSGSRFTNISSVTEK